MEENNEKRKRGRPFGAKDGSKRKRRTTAELEAAGVVCASTTRPKKARATVTNPKKKRAWKRRVLPDGADARLAGINLVHDRRLPPCGTARIDAKSAGLHWEILNGYKCAWAARIGGDAEAARSLDRAVKMAARIVWYDRFSHTNARVVDGLTGKAAALRDMTRTFDEDAPTACRNVVTYHARQIILPYDEVAHTHLVELLKLLGYCDAADVRAGVAIATSRSVFEDMWLTFKGERNGTEEN